jgi:hypothetical protein
MPCMLRLYFALKLLKPRQTRQTGQKLLITYNLLIIFSSNNVLLSNNNLCLLKQKSRIGGYF